ncbi:hypothetical protein HDU86_005317 [Geranomyces michiganensis]|nr:hypothetical protein HDU86_005317 [Geranomyces michiganensis]
MPANHTYDAYLISLSSGPVSAKRTPAGTAKPKKHASALLASSSASVASNKSSASSRAGHVIGAVPHTLPRI